MRFKYAKKGFALPSVVVASIILLGMLALALQLSTTADGALKDQYYNQLAREAAESGVARFRECMRQRIRPTLGKKYVPNSRSCQDPSVDPANSAYTMISGNMRARYEVSLEKSDVNKHVINSNGHIDLLRPSGGVWKTVNYSGKVVLSELDVLINKFTMLSTLSTNHILRPDGILWGWGYNHSGSAGVGLNGEVYSPAQVFGDVKKIINGSGRLNSSVGLSETDFIIALKNNGSLWAWGGNEHGTLGDGTTISKNHPVQIMAGGVKDIFSINSSIFALKSDNSLWAWGANQTGKLGNGNDNDVLSPIKIMGADTASVNKITGTNLATFAMKDDGSLWAWGNVGGVIGSPARQLPKKVLVSQVKDIQISQDNRLVVLTTDGRVMRWLYSSRSAALPEPSPSYVNGLQNIHRVYLGDGNYYAIDTSGALFGWYSSGWMMGDGVDRRPASYKTYPSEVVKKIIGSGVKDIKSSVDVLSGDTTVSTYVLKNDGTVWAWGTNKNCALQNSDKAAFYLVPTQIMSGVKAIHVTDFGSTFAAIKNDNTMWTWGRFTGDGSPTSSDFRYFRCSPVKVLDNVTYVHGDTHRTFQY